MSTEKIHNLFEAIYGSEKAEGFRDELDEILHDFSPVDDLPPSGLSAYDTILITYGDAIQKNETPALAVMKSFMDTHVGGRISTIHLLPFFPYSSDDGFSVIDYYRVDPDLGSWEAITALGENYDLMFDAVINHLSVKSEWFGRFLKDEPSYAGYFITVDEKEDLSQVFRPRALPLLTLFEASTGTVRVWTTFSEDQVDLNYANPKVLLDILRILLMFVSKGARFIRLDAIAYIWKEIGTSCLHLPNAHRIVKLFRAVFDEIAPYIQIITETNVPHQENISYFGDGTDEAQLVYNFSLPPLTLHAFHKRDVTWLSKWAKTLSLPSDLTSYFNFLASHDGIGVTPAKGLIPAEDILEMCRRIEQLGGYVSYKTNADGSQSPYELNINYLDALGDPEESNVSDQLRANRFLAAQSIMLVLKGVPGIYYHSLFGSRGWPRGVELTGRKRSINREKLNLDGLVAEIQSPDHLRYDVFNGYLALLEARQRVGDPLFSPYGDQEILEPDARVFTVLRSSPLSGKKILCLTNVSDQEVNLDLEKVLPADHGKAGWEKVISRDCEIHFSQGASVIDLQPYGVIWLESKGD
jgi:sucrose phosphorylase